MRKMLRSIQCFRCSRICRSFHTQTLRFIIINPLRPSWVFQVVGTLRALLLWSPVAYTPCRSEGTHYHMTHWPKCALRVYMTADSLSGLIPSCLLTRSLTGRPDLSSMKVGIVIMLRERLEHNRTRLQIAIRQLDVISGMLFGRRPTELPLLSRPVVPSPACGRKIPHRVPGGVAGWWWVQQRTFRRCECAQWIRQARVSHGLPRLAGVARCGEIDEMRCASNRI